MTQFLFLSKAALELVPCGQRAKVTLSPAKCGKRHFISSLGPFSCCVVFHMSLTPWERFLKSKPVITTTKLPNLYLRPILSFVSGRLNVTPTVSAAAKVLVFLRESPGFREEGMLSVFLHDRIEAVPFDQGLQFILSFFEERNALLKDAADIVHFHSQHFVHVSLFHALLTDQIHHLVAFPEGHCFRQQRILIHKHHNLEEMPPNTEIPQKMSPCTERQSAQLRPRPPRVFSESHTVLHNSNQEARCYYWTP